MAQKFLFLPKIIHSSLTRKLSTTLVTNQIPVAGQNLIQIDVNETTGYGILSLNSSPANSLNVDLLTSLSTAMDEMERNKSRGVILTSNLPDIFCAGLELNILHNSDSKELAELFSASQDSFLKAYDSSFPIAAAVNGHAIGGGCFFAMACDYRAMISGYKIGLNEIQVGVSLPRMLVMLLPKLVPRHQAEMALTQGILYTPENAKQINLVDDIASDKKDAMAKCEAFLNRVNKIPRDAWKKTRFAIRREEIEYLRNNKAKDIEDFVRSVKTDEAQQIINMYVKNLNKK